MSLATLIAESQQNRESWKYTDLKKLAAVDFQPLLPANNDAAARPLPTTAQLTFIDGIWQPQASQLLGLPTDIMQGDAEQGYQLTLAGQVCLIISPLELRFISTGSQTPSQRKTKLKIKLGDSGRITLLETHEIAPAQSADAVQIIQTEIELGTQAKLVHGKIVQGGANQIHLAETKVQIGAGAYYDNFSLLLNGQLTRNQMQINLAAELAQCHLQGIQLLRGKSHADTTLCINHAAPHGTSRQIYKSVADNASRAIFQGQVVVAEGAQKTDAHQLSRALLLSDQAEANAKPELEIFADDVKCSHGSTIGDLDEQALFYLQSRGLPADLARAMLIRAFVEELVGEIQAPEIRAAVSTEVGVWLHG